MPGKARAQSDPGGQRMDAGHCFRDATHLSRLQREESMVLRSLFGVAGSASYAKGRRRPLRPPLSTLASAGAPPPTTTEAKKVRQALALPVLPLYIHPVGNK